ncbi:hypothetical protein D3C73_1550630 [compost metagenome]
MYFASNRFLVKDDRCILALGDSLTETHLDEAVTRVYDCVIEINNTLRENL